MKTHSIFKLLCENKTQYIPPFKLENKSFMGVSVSPEDQIIDSLGIKNSSTKVENIHETPFISDTKGEIKKSISTVSIVKNINWMIYHPSRAGIIPYIKKGKEIIFCLAEDMMRQQLIDFGGGVAFYESSLEGAIKEAAKTSLGIVTPTMEKINQSIIVTSKYTMLIFLRVDSNPMEYVNAYNKSKDMFDTSSIYWITQHQLKGLIEEIYPEGKIKLYYKIKNVLNPIYDCLIESILNDGKTLFEPPLIEVPLSKSDDGDVFLPETPIQVPITNRVDHISYKDSLKR